MDSDVPDPITDEELLYRRIPAQWFDPDLKEVNSAAFAPHKERDTSGLSVWRAKFKSLEEVARGQPGKIYYVAVLNVADLIAAGIRVVPQPDVPGGYDIAHAELPDLNSTIRKDSKTIETTMALARLCRSVEGPFTTLPTE